MVYTDCKVQTGYSTFKLTHFADKVPVILQIRSVVPCMVAVVSQKQQGRRQVKHTLMCKKILYKSVGRQAIRKPVQSSLSPPTLLGDSLGTAEVQVHSVTESFHVLCSFQESRSVVGTELSDTECIPRMGGRVFFKKQFYPKKEGVQRLKLNLGSTHQKGLYHSKNL